MADWPVVHNPFRTAFGSQPPLFVGRHRELGLIRSGLGSGPGAKYFGTILLGQRGYGKTVLLGKIRREAAEHGWPVLHLNCSAQDVLEELRQRALRLLKTEYASILKNSQTL